jgi:hypothetical protein
MLNIHFEYAALRYTLKDILQNYDQLVFLIILIVLLGIFVIALDSFSLDHIRQLKLMALTRNKKQKQQQDLPKHQIDDVSAKRKQSTLIQDENKSSFIHRSNVLNIALQME